MAGEEKVKEAVTDAAVAAEGAAEAAAEQTQEATEAIQSSMENAAEGASETFDALSPASESATLSSDSLALLSDLSVSSVYLMGSSFILGVLFTVFVLLVLDFMRRNSDTQGK